MNELLIASGTDAASPAEPAELIAALSDVLPVLLAGAIGYLFGLLRDASRAKSERKARRHEEILTASAEILSAAQSLSKAHMGLAHTIWEQTHDGGTPTEYRVLLEDRRQEAFRDISAHELAAQPHIMKLKILAPQLADKVTALMSTVERRGNTPKAWEEAGEKHLEASKEFTEAVREELKISS